PLKGSKFFSDFFSIFLNTKKIRKKFGTFERKPGLLKYHCFFLEESKRAPRPVLVLGLFSICRLSDDHSYFVCCDDAATAKSRSASKGAKTASR
ncbi:MAG: hypothetical protein AAGJ57_02195, partial [Pseudomonadota bacterium]